MNSYISPWGNDPQPYLMKHFFWPHIIKVSNKWNKPGDFITLIGYEWSSLAQGPGGPVLVTIMCIITPMMRHPFILILTMKHLI